VPSEVYTKFHDAVQSGLPADAHHLLFPAVGTGQAREPERAYGLAQRALVWASTAVEERAPEAPSSFARLPQTIVPEAGHHIVSAASMQARQVFDDALLDEICRAVMTIGEALTSIDEVAPPERNRDAFATIANEAAVVLLAAGAIRGEDWEWVCRRGERLVVSIEKVGSLVEAPPDFLRSHRGASSTWTLLAITGTSCRDRFAFGI